MDARPSSEQRELEGAADRLARKLGPGSVGDLDDRERRGRLDAALAQTGWRELRSGSPAEPMASGVEAALVARALARRACDVAFLGPVLAGDLLRRAGSEVDEVARTVVLAADLSEVAGTGMRPGADGGWYLAVDTRDRVAGTFLRCEGGGHRVVETTIDETMQRSFEGVDLTRPVVRVAADADAPIVDGTWTLSPDDLTAWTALAVALTAADLVGAMEGTLELATEYAKDRRQYGAAIGSYQAVQHLLAEAKTLAEGAVSTMLHAAWAVDALEPGEARRAAAVAKAYAARAARTVCETSIQVHGGIGNTWDCMAHVFLRRTLLATELFGGDGPQLALLASQRWGAVHGLR